MYTINNEHMFELKKYFFLLGIFKKKLLLIDEIKTIENKFNNSIAAGFF